MSMLRRSLMTSRRAAASGTSDPINTIAEETPSASTFTHYPSRGSYAAYDSSRSSRPTGATPISNDNSFGSSDLLDTVLLNTSWRVRPHESSFASVATASLESSQRRRVNALLSSVPSRSPGRFHLIDLASTQPSTTRPVLSRPPLHPSASSAAPPTSTDDMDRYERLENFRRLRRFAYNTRSSRSASEHAATPRDPHDASTNAGSSSGGGAAAVNSSSSTSGLSGRYYSTQNSSRTRAEDRRSRYVCVFN